MTLYQTQHSSVSSSWQYHADANLSWKLEVAHMTCTWFKKSLHHNIKHNLTYTSSGFGSAENMKLHTWHVLDFKSHFTIILIKHNLMYTSSGFGSDGVSFFLFFSRRYRAAWCSGVTSSSPRLFTSVHQAEWNNRFRLKGFLLKLLKDILNQCNCKP